MLQSQYGGPTEDGQRLANFKLLRRQLPDFSKFRREFRTQFNNIHDIEVSVCQLVYHYENMSI